MLGRFGMVMAALMVVVVVDAMVVSSFLHLCSTMVVTALCELPKKVHTGYERDDDQLRCVTDDDMKVGREGIMRKKKK